MFIRSARFYDALYGFKDYAAASEKLHAIIRRHCPRAKRLLDVGCGTGRHLAYLQTAYDVEGLDLNPDLLALARARCPGVAFHEGDMVDFALNRRFDVVTCLFSAIGYVRTLARMQAAILNMARHLEPGGLLVVEPWFTPDRYWTGTITTNFVDEPDLKIVWMYASEVEGRVSVLDQHFLVGTPGAPGRVEHFTERHELGLFTHEEQMEAFGRAGLEARHDPEGLFKRGLYLGLRPAAPPAVPG